MLTLIKQHLLNNLSLSVVSLLLGYALWQSMSQPYTLKAAFTVPVSFYNTEQITLEAPEHVTITLHGTRKELYKLAPNLAVHLNAQSFTEPETIVRLSESNLFLPESVTLLNCEPMKVTIKQ